MSVLVKPRPAELAERHNAAVREKAGGAGYRWKPIDVPEKPRPRGLIASMTSFLVAYHTA